MVQSMVTIANHGSTVFKLWLAIVTIVNHSHHFAGVLAYSHTGASVSPKLCKSPEKKTWQNQAHMQVRCRGCKRTPLAGQIISKSYSFSPETEFTPLILASKSEYS